MGQLCHKNRWMQASLFIQHSHEHLRRRPSQEICLHDKRRHIRGSWDKDRSEDRRRMPPKLSVSPRCLRQGSSSLSSLVTETLSRLAEVFRHKEEGRPN